MAKNRFIIQTNNSNSNSNSNTNSNPSIQSFSQKHSFVILHFVTFGRIGEALSNILHITQNAKNRLGASDTTQS